MFNMPVEAASSSMAGGNGAMRPNPFQQILDQLARNAQEAEQRFSQQTQDIQLLRGALAEERALSQARAQALHEAVEQLQANATPTTEGVTPDPQGETARADEPATNPTAIASDPVPSD